MITALGEDIAFAMCMGCPVPLSAVKAFCHMYRGPEGLDKGNLCLLREIERRHPGILKLKEFSPYHNDDGAKKALEDRRQAVLKAESDEYSAQYAVDIEDTVCFGCECKDHCKYAGDPANMPGDICLADK